MWNNGVGKAAWRLGEAAEVVEVRQEVGGRPGWYNVDIDEGGRDVEKWGCDGDAGSRCGFGWAGMSKSYVAATNSGKASPIFLADCRKTNV